MMPRPWRAACAALAVAASSASAWADQPVVVDRVVVRFDAPETGGVAKPKFIFERELAFEARLEALGDTDRTERSVPFIDRHVRAAMERHVAEELLSNLAMDPEPTAAELLKRVAGAREILSARVGGDANLSSAAQAEGIEQGDLDALLSREARASLYLDRMVAPMLEPSEAELREVHRSGANPYRGQHFDDVMGALRTWYVAERLAAALGAFFQNATARVHVTVF
jgi:hypothetical protein